MADFHVSVLVDPVEPGAHDGATWAASIADVDPPGRRGRRLLDARGRRGVGEVVRRPPAGCSSSAPPGSRPSSATRSPPPARRPGSCCAPTTPSAPSWPSASRPRPPRTSTPSRSSSCTTTARSTPPRAPSLAAVRAMAAAREAAGRAPIVNPTTRETLANTRGGEGAGGIRVHSVRLPGLAAHQEILFGGRRRGLDHPPRLLRPGELRQRRRARAARRDALLGVRRGDRPVPRLRPPRHPTGSLRV